MRTLTLLIFFLVSVDYLTSKFPVACCRVIHSK